MKFNEKIVKLRKLKGLTQDEFAAAVGVSRQAVYKWESGQSYPEVPKMLEIKLLFDVSIDDLLDEGYEVVIPEKTKRKRVSREKRAEIEAAVRGESKEEKTDTVCAGVRADAVLSEESIAPSLEEYAEEEKTPEVKEASAEKTSVESDSAAKAPEREPETRKVGFFGRLFGRK